MRYIRNIGKIGLFSCFSLYIMHLHFEIYSFHYAFFMQYLHLTLSIRRIGNHTFYKIRVFLTVNNVKILLGILISNIAVIIRNELIRSVNTLRCILQLLSVLSLTSLIFIRERYNWMGIYNNNKTCIIDMD